MVTGASGAVADGSNRVRTKEAGSVFLLRIKKKKRFFCFFLITFQLFFVFFEYVFLYCGTCTSAARCSLLPLVSAS